MGTRALGEPILDSQEVSLTVCIITKNEEGKLPDCLASVQWVPEVIVVDDFSEDQTPAICRSFNNVRYCARALEGFGFQKAHAVSLATKNWVLNIDADERVTDELREEIVCAIAAPADYAGYKVRLKHFWFDTTHVDSYPGGLRLFKKRFGTFGPYYVHEKVDLVGAVGQLEHFLLHHPKSGENLTSYYRKYVLRYGPLAARDYLARGQRVTALNFCWKVVAIPLLVFLRDYLLKSKFKLGKIGFYVALCAAISYHKSYWYLLKLQHTNEVVGSKID